VIAPIGGLVFDGLRGRFLLFMLMPNNGKQIARRLDCREAKIALFLLDPNPKMPGMGLSRAEAADLAATWPP
jgi:hypothetical protein